MEVPILNLILIFVTICGCFKCHAQYCDSSRVAPCLNNKLDLCDGERIKNVYPKNNFNKTTRDVIIAVLNDFRAKIAEFQKFCLLPKFEWSDDLEYMAANIIADNHNGDCLITKDFKNICVYKKKIYATGCFKSGVLNKDLFRDKLKTEFQSLINKIDFKYETSNTTSLKRGSWLYSAFSNRIGCSYICNDLEECTITCLINGFEIKYFGQNYANATECNVKNKINDLNTPCDSTVNNCKLKQHFICNITDKFVNTKLATMTYVEYKFILFKLESEEKYVVWDHDLQYLASQLVTQHILSDHEICVALERFNIINSIHLSDTKYFTELISNIDSVWYTTSVNYTGKIGCALYDTDDKFNIYCLYTGDQWPNSSGILDFLRYINFNERDSFFLYAFEFMVYGTILAIIVFLYCLKSYERKRFLFSSNDI